MALKNAGAALVTGGATIYTCPQGLTATVERIHVANVDGTNSASVTASWTDASNGNAARKIAHAVPVAGGDVLNIGCGLVLEEGDTLVASASADGDLEMTLAITEAGNVTG